MNFSIFENHDDTFGALRAAKQSITLTGSGTASTAYAEGVLATIVTTSYNAQQPTGVRMASCQVRRQSGRNVDFTVVIENDCSTGPVRSTSTEIAIAVKNVFEAIAFDTGSVQFAHVGEMTSCPATATPPPQGDNGGHTTTPQVNSQPPAATATDSLLAFFKAHETEAMLGAAILLVLLVKK